MRQILLEEFGGPEVLIVRDVPEPSVPQDGWMIEVRAAALNYADVVERRGLYRKEQRCPYPLGKEAAGVVVECGEAAQGFEVGDEVIVVRFDGGCYAERVSARPGQILQGPPGYSMEELAAFSLVFGTAWYGMHEFARIRAGESVLIQAAAGGVGSAAVALARSHGCSQVLATAGGPEKCAWVEERGADRCIDYLKSDFSEEVRALTNGRGVDYVLESVGGEVFDRSLELLAPMGRMVMIGFSSISEDYGAAIKRVHPLTLFHRSISLAGLNVENLDLPGRPQSWSALVSHLVEHGIRPAIGGCYPLDEARDAHTALESRRSRGKLLLLP